jgi:hypothetical protein
MKKDNAQTMVLEVSFFTVMVILSLLFMYRLSPASVVSSDFTDDLSNQGTDALLSIYNNIPSGDHPSNYPSNALVHYIITNDYEGMISDLNALFQSNIMYNLYITNETEQLFWCSSYQDSSYPLQTIDPVTIVHCLIAIDPIYINSSTDELFRDGQPNPLASTFSDYTDDLYEVQLVLWRI